MILDNYNKKGYICDPTYEPHLYIHLRLAHRQMKLFPVSKSTSSHTQQRKSCQGILQKTNAYSKNNKISILQK